VISMYVIFENNKWVVGWSNKTKTRLRIQSKEGKGFATAFLAQRIFRYDNMDMGQRAPRIAYINEDIVPAYIKGKITLAFARGERWR
jgi:hypothetical protein